MGGASRTRSKGPPVEKRVTRRSAIANESDTKTSHNNDGKSTSAEDAQENNHDIDVNDNVIDHSGKSIEFHSPYKKGGNIALNKDKGDEIVSNNTEKEDNDALSANEEDAAAGTRRSTRKRKLTAKATNATVEILLAAQKRSQSNNNDGISEIGDAMGDDDESAVSDEGTTGGDHQNENDEHDDSISLSKRSRELGGKRKAAKMTTSDSDDDQPISTMIRKQQNSKVITRKNNPKSSSMKKLTRSSSTTKRHHEKDNIDKSSSDSSEESTTNDPIIINVKKSTTTKLGAEELKENSDRSGIPTRKTKQSSITKLGGGELLLTENSDRSDISTRKSSTITKLGGNELLTENSDRSIRKSTRIRRKSLLDRIDHHETEHVDADHDDAGQHALQLLPVSTDDEPTQNEPIPVTESSIDDDIMNDENLKDMNLEDTTVINVNVNDIEVIETKVCTDSENLNVVDATQGIDIDSNDISVSPQDANDSEEMNTEDPNITGSENLNIIGTTQGLEIDSNDISVALQDAKESEQINTEESNITDSENMNVIGATQGLDIDSNDISVSPQDAKDSEQIKMEDPNITDSENLSIIGATQELDIDSNDISVSPKNAKDSEQMNTDDPNTNDSENLNVIDVTQGLDINSNDISVSPQNVNDSEQMNTEDPNTNDSENLNVNGETQGLDIDCNDISVLPQDANDSEPMNTDDPNTNDSENLNVIGATQVLDIDSNDISVSPQDAKDSEQMNTEDPNITDSENLNVIGVTQGLDIGSNDIAVSPQDANDSEQMNTEDPNTNDSENLNVIGETQGLDIDSNEISLLPQDAKDSEQMNTEDPIVMSIVQSKESDSVIEVEQSNIEYSNSESIVDHDKIDVSTNPDLCEVDDSVSRDQDKDALDDVTDFKNEVETEKSLIISTASKNTSKEIEENEQEGENIYSNVNNDSELVSLENTATVDECALKDTRKLSTDITSEQQYDAEAINLDHPPAPDIDINTISSALVYENSKMASEVHIETGIASNKQEKENSEVILDNSCQTEDESLLVRLDEETDNVLSDKADVEEKHLNDMFDTTSEIPIIQTIPGDESESGRAAAKRRSKRDKERSTIDVETSARIESETEEIEVDKELGAVATSSMNETGESDIAFDRNNQSTHDRLETANGNSLTALSVTSVPEDSSTIDPRNPVIEVVNPFQEQINCSESDLKAGDHDENGTSEATAVDMMHLTTSKDQSSVVSALQEIDSTSISDSPSQAKQATGSIPVRSPDDLECSHVPTTNDLASSSDGGDIAMSRLSTSNSAVGLIDEPLIAADEKVLSLMPTSVAATDPLTFVDTDSITNVSIPVQDTMVPSESLQASTSSTTNSDSGHVFANEETDMTANANSLCVNEENKSLLANETSEATSFISTNALQDGCNSLSFKIDEKQKDTPDVPHSFSKDDTVADKEELTAQSLCSLELVPNDKENTIKADSASADEEKIETHNGDMFESSSRIDLTSSKPSACIASIDDNVHNSIAQATGLFTVIYNASSKTDQLTNAGTSEPIVDTRIDIMEAEELDVKDNIEAKCDDVCESSDHSAISGQSNAGEATLKKMTKIEIALDKTTLVSVVEVDDETIHPSNEGNMPVDPVSTDKKPQACIELGIGSEAKSDIKDSEMIHRGCISTNSEKTLIDQGEFSEALKSEIIVHVTRNGKELVGFEEVDGVRDAFILSERSILAQNTTFEGRDLGERENRSYVQKDLPASEQRCSDESKSSLQSPEVTVQNSKAESPCHLTGVEGGFNSHKRKRTESTLVGTELSKKTSSDKRVKTIKKARLQLNQVKYLLFAAGKRVHRGRGYESLFSEYWNALSSRIEGTLPDSQMQRCRFIVDSFLKTKMLRKIHNKLIMGLLSRCMQPTTPSHCVAHVLPESWSSRIKLVSTKVETKDSVIVSQTLRPEAELQSEKLINEPYRPLFKEIRSELVALKPQLPRSSLRIPGAMVVDPLVRSFAQSSGVGFSEDASWLLVVAIREYTKALVKNAIDFYQEVEDAYPVSRSDVKSVALWKNGSLLSKGKDKDDVKSITARHLHAYSSNMRIGGSRSLSNRIGRTAFERSSHIAQETWLTTGADQYDDVKQFVVSYVNSSMGNALSDCLVEPDLSLQTKHDLLTSSMTSSSGMDLASSPLVRHHPPPRSSPLQAESSVMEARASRSDKIAEPSSYDIPVPSSKRILSAQPGLPSERAVSQVTTPERATHVRGGLGRGAKDLASVRGGLGRGAKDLASLLARAKTTPTTNISGAPPSPPKSPLDTSSKVQTTEEGPSRDSVNVVARVSPLSAVTKTGPPAGSDTARRGKGFGLKNLAAMMARSQPGKQEESDETEKG